MEKLKQLWVAIFLGAAVFLTGCATGEAGRVVDDSVVTSRVKTRLIEDQALKAFQINVETYRGDVLLSGFVESQDQINRAVEIAKNSDGVRSVKNAMVVRKDEATGAPSGGEKEDAKRE